MRRKAFTLLELLLANMLIAILLGALLLLISSLSREQKQMADLPGIDANAILNILRRDLSNSESARLLPNERGFILTGHAGLDSKSLSPTDRRTRVIYEIRRKANTLCLIRAQTYLDDPIKPQKFEELLATNITSLSLLAPGAAWVDEDELNLDETSAFTLPPSVTVHLGLPHRQMNEVFFLR